MSELAQCLIGDSYATPAVHILEALTETQVHQTIPNTPHTVYQELWHLVFWQQVTLDWIAGTETPYPTSPSDAFPAAADEPWPVLRERFLAGARKAAAAQNLDTVVRCPSRPPEPIRTMTVRDQLTSLAAHNAYHLGRIILLRQLLSAWPPPSGGFDW